MHAIRQFRTEPTAPALAARRRMVHLPGGVDSPLMPARGSGAAQVRSAPPPQPPMDAPPLDANACILAIARGADRAAFAQLFGFFAPRVKTYLQRHGAAPAAAEDLAQETMLTVWRKASSFDPLRAGAATWIFTIARNLRIDALRRDGPAGPPVEAVEEACQAPGAEQTLLASEQESLLRTALRSLPAEQVAVIQLSFFGGLAHAEIERTLGIPLGTVKSRLRLAMARLRAALEPRP